MSSPEDPDLPNGDFETIYKPGSTTITATLTGWTQGVGPDCPIDSGQYDFSDQTTGSVADIPGWVELLPGQRRRLGKPGRWADRLECLRRQY